MWVGLPQLCFEVNLMKEYFDKQGKNGYNYTYVYPGINKVLQAGGRLIRSENDRRTIALIDDRFLQKQYQRIIARGMEGDALEKMINTSLVGIGRLGKALMKQWNHFNEEIGIFHPSDVKVKSFISDYSNGVPVSIKELPNMKTIILALPAAIIPEFLKQNHHSDIIYVNMATAMKTSDLQKEFPELQIVSMKFVGHAQDLYKNGNGYFITEQETTDDIVKLFTRIGVVKRGAPEIVNEVNKLATYYGIKAAVELENELKVTNIDQSLIDRALTAVTPEVIKSYQKGDLGHFAQSVAEEVKQSIRK